MERIGCKLNTELFFSLNVCTMCTTSVAVQLRENVCNKMRSASALAKTKCGEKRMKEKGTTTTIVITTQQHHKDMERKHRFSIYNN